MAHTGYSLLLQKLYMLPQGLIPVRCVTNPAGFSETVHSDQAGNSSGNKSCMFLGYSIVFCK